MFRKKIPFGRIIPPFFFESSESDRVFNYLHDSNSIFRARGEGVSGGTVFSPRDSKRRVSLSFRDNQSFAWTARASCRRRFSQATRVNRDLCTRSGEECKMSSLTTTMLNLLFAEAEQEGKTRHFRTYIGPGSDGSSADKVSLGLKFNPWDTAISFRPE